jgi:hypothetical protein
LLESTVLLEMCGLLLLHGGGIGLSSFGLPHVTTTAHANNGKRATVTSVCAAALHKANNAI